MNHCWATLGSIAARKGWYALRVKRPETHFLSLHEPKKPMKLLSVGAGLASPGKPRDDEDLFRTLNADESLYKNKILISISHSIIMLARHISMADEGLPSLDAAEGRCSLDSTIAICAR